MDDLVTFIRAQLDEDEGLARTAIGEPWSGTVEIGPNEDDLLCNDSGISRHIVRWDPARVLAEVDAKRRVLRLYESSSDAQFPDSDGGYASAIEDVMLLLALPYADRPGYRDEWKP
ncbi:DUF6221 family protein [Mangrovihabitans endophyticus]|nr:DUF6221 family protein [Mangrovihabitans endophyticus]